MDEIPAILAMEVQATRHQNREDEIYSHDEISPRTDEKHSSHSADDDDDENCYSDDQSQNYCSSSWAKSSNFSLQRTTTKSRLIDPPPNYDGKSHNLKRHSSQLKPSGMKSGLVAKTGMLETLEEDNEDDPFDEGHHEFSEKHRRWGAMLIIQWVFFLAILAALICILTVPHLLHSTVSDLHLWKWCVLVLVLFSGRLISGWGIRLVVFFVEQNFILRKRVLYFVYGVRKPVQNCLWLGLVLIAWHFLLDKRVERETGSKSLPYVTKVLVCLLVGTIIWLVKTLLVKVLASSFHVSTYFDRIQESLFNQYVLETLSGPPVMEIEMSYIMEEEKLMTNVPSNDINDRSTVARSGGIIHSKGFSGMISTSNSKEDKGLEEKDVEITVEHLQKLTHKNISAWTFKKLMKIVTHRVLSIVDDSFHDGESTTQITSEWEAKAAAKKIFNNVAKPGNKYISLKDLNRFLREDEVIKAMSVFEHSKHANRLTKADLKNWAVNVFRERRSLSLTLNDTKTAVKKLHQMINVVVGIVIIIIWVLILGLASTHIILIICSQSLLAVFVFGDTCKAVFESIVFLFVMHPFDVGDRCSIDGVHMIVEEMNIMTTVFLRYDNEKIWYPNSVLATKPISNIYRSPDMGDAIDFTIHIATPMEKVSIMREKIKRYIENKPDHWYPNPMIVVKNIEDMNKMKMAVWLQHRMNHQNMGEKSLRRSNLVEEMINIFRDLDIEHRMLPLDVNLQTLPALDRFPSTWMT